MGPARNKKNIGFTFSPLTGINLNIGLTPKLLFATIIATIHEKRNCDHRVDGICVKGDLISKGHLVSKQYHLCLTGTLRDNADNQIVNMPLPLSNHGGKHQDVFMPGRDYLDMNKYLISNTCQC